MREDKTCEYTPKPLFRDRSTMQRHFPSMLLALPLCLASLTLVGCGNKGELYLKDDPDVTGSGGNVDALIDTLRGVPDAAATIDDEPAEGESADDEPVKGEPIKGEPVDGEPRRTERRSQ